MVRIYDTKRWKHLRESVLRRDGYQDQLELRTGKKVNADTVHHIFPVDMYPQYQWQSWNLISLTNENHELMHNRLTKRLSPLGLKLMREKAEERGIPLSLLTLVIGERGSGKTTYVKHHLGDGLAYDLDYISAAFRLSKPHAEVHDVSRRLANSLCIGFANKARQYSSRVYIIRTAPSIEELEAIDPDRIVVCEGQHNITTRQDYRGTSTQEERDRIRECVEFAQINGIAVERIK